MFLVRENSVRNCLSLLFLFSKLEINQTFLDDPSELISVFECGGSFDVCPTGRDTLPINCQRYFYLRLNKSDPVNADPPAIVNYRPVYLNFNGTDCIWFDELGYWRKGDCDCVGEASCSSDTLQMSKRDMDCPIIEWDTLGKL